MTAPRWSSATPSIGRGVPFLETREKAHFIRIDENEWDLARQALRAANPAGSN